MPGVMPKFKHKFMYSIGRNMESWYVFNVYNATGDYMGTRIVTQDYFWHGKR